MEVPEAVEEMTETVIETGLEATIGQIIPIQVNIRCGHVVRDFESEAKTR